MALFHLRRRKVVAFPNAKTTVVDNLPSEKVLVLAPHPDDEVIGLGGCLCQYAKNESEITVVYLTDGGANRPDRQLLVETRRREAESVGSSLGAKQEFWNEPDTQLTSNPETIDRMKATVEQIKPDVIFLPHFFDTHLDHFATNQILMDTLALLPEMRFDIAGYEIWHNIPVPNYVVDVRAEFDQKQELMEFYKTPLKSMDFIKLFGCRATVHYMLFVDHSLKQNEQGYAEAFLRFDGLEYRRQFEDFVDGLRNGSNPSNN